MAVLKSQELIQCFCKELLAVFWISKLKRAVAAARRVLGPDIFPGRSLTWCFVMTRDPQYCVSILPCSAFPEGML